MDVTDEMVEVIGKALWRYWDDVKPDAKAVYRTKTRAALVEALKIMPPAAPAPVAGDAVAKLPEKWRKEADTLTSLCDLSVALISSAHELEAALAQDRASQAGAP